MHQPLGQLRHRLAVTRAGDRSFVTNRFMACLITHQPRGNGCYKDIAICAGGLWFDSRAGQTGHSVAISSSPLQRIFGAGLFRRFAAHMGPVTPIVIHAFA